MFGHPKQAESSLVLSGITSRARGHSPDVLIEQSAANHRGPGMEAGHCPHMWAGDHIFGQVLIRHVARTAARSGKLQPDGFADLGHSRRAFPFSAVYRHQCSEVAHTRMGHRFGGRIPFVDETHRLNDDRAHLACHS